MATRVMVPEPCGSCDAQQTELMFSGDLRTVVRGSLRELVHAAIGRFGLRQLSVYCWKCGDFGVMVA